MSNLFQPQIPIVLANSYLTVDFAIPLPRMLNFDFISRKKLQIRQQSGIENSAAVQTICLNLIRSDRKPMKSNSRRSAFFVNMTVILTKHVQPFPLFEMAAATAITLEPLLTKTSCKLLSVFVLCHRVKPKKTQMDGGLPM